MLQDISCTRPVCHMTRCVWGKSEFSSMLWGLGNGCSKYIAECEHQLGKKLCLKCLKVPQRSVRVAEPFLAQSGGFFSTLLPVMQNLVSKQWSCETLLYGLDRVNSHYGKLQVEPLDEEAMKSELVVLWSNLDFFFVTRFHLFGKSTQSAKGHSCTLL